jgi:hypothetical protein
LYTLFFLVLTAVCSAVSLIRRRKDLSVRRVVETLLFYLLLVNVGFTGLFAFYGHAFLSDQVAAGIGWPKGSPFQLEIAATNLAFGVLGVLCVFFRDDFWLATGLGYSLFLFGAAFVHIREILAAGNLALYNAGPVLYVGDIGVPTLILALLILRGRLKRAS